MEASRKYGRLSCRGHCNSKCCSFELAGGSEAAADHGGAEAHQCAQQVGRWREPLIEKQASSSPRRRGIPGHGDILYIRGGDKETAQQCAHGVGSLFVGFTRLSGRGKVSLH